MTALWKQILSKEFLTKIKASDGISIPFIVGTYYECGIISEEMLNSKECIGFILADIVSNIEKGNELALFRCGNRVILQYLKNGERTQKDIDSIKKGYSHMCNTIYLDMYIFNNPSYTIDELSEILWNNPTNNKMLSEIKSAIIQHKFNSKFGGWLEFTHPKSVIEYDAVKSLKETHSQLCKE